MSHITQTPWRVPQTFRSETRRVLRGVLAVLIVAATIAIPACGDGTTSNPPPDASAQQKSKKDEMHGRAGRAAEALADDAMGASPSPAPGEPANASSKQDDHKKKSHETDDASGVMFYISMHGEKGGNSLAGLTSSGSLVSNVLQDASGTVGATLKDLRGMCKLSDGSLLVVNAWQQDTRIVQYGPEGADGLRPFVKVFIQGGETNPAMQHTYSVLLGPDGNVYCSNQDSNTVTRYQGPTGSTPGAPLPAPPALERYVGLPPGIFITDSHTSAHGVHAVRGLAFGPDGLLYVSDRDAHRVYSFDPKTGDRKAIVVNEEDGLKQPIQLAFSPDGNYLFVGDDDANCVWRKDLQQGKVEMFIKPNTGGLDAPSALLIEGEHLFVGNRKGKSVLRFKLPEGKLHSHPFADKLPDNPEFLLPAH
jgi:hypothetical protein